ncbi:DUF4179 domain-containing protein [Clostridium sp. D2Q-11]|uniref:DUF4179 domain-containing protein n=1 Tax=Anaeromonas frigoriresistens TaxID=2683708 RepID=A0A942UTH9_9FIRM|nr:DUF4179 domain-containing protein [Anaeromonas frigoriresistens]MBS4537145.1 DUF4179 domain-containing protein [Anaeromonas frigoriresistens]
MDNNKIKLAIDKIEVPKEDVLNAIRKGMEQDRESVMKISAKKKFMISYLATAAALGIIFLSGFISPKINQVLASAPFIGRIYEEFGDKLGIELAKEDLVTQLDEEITRNGVTVKLKNAYFDGDILSVIGHINGNVGNGELSIDVNFENHKGDNDPWLNGKSTAIKKSDEGYDFQWKFKYPYKEIDKEFTLPISIHNINGIKGNWNFNIPIKQEINETLVINQFKAYESEEIRININEINTAKATTTMIFETISKHKKDQIDFYKAEDDYGNVLFTHENNTNLNHSKEEDGYHNLLRKNINKVDKSIKSIKLYPFVNISESPVQESLDKSAFILKSKRTDMAIEVNNVTKDNNKLIFDYNFNGLPQNISEDKLDIIVHNLSYSFLLVDKDFVNDINPDNPVPPKDHSISKNNVKLINKNTYHFRSVFPLDGEEKIENLSLKDTILQFNFDSFIETKKLEPFSIELTN